MPAPRPDADRRRRLAEAFQISRTLLEGVPESMDNRVKQRWQKRLRQLQAELKTCTHPIQTQRLARHDIPLPVRRAFVQAVAMVTRYSFSGGLGWRGTLNSPTLAKYQTDPVPPQWHCPEAIAQFCQEFALDDEARHEIEQIVRRADRCLAEQRSLMGQVLATAAISDTTIRATQRGGAPAPLPAPLLAPLEDSTQGTSPIPMQSSMAIDRAFLVELFQRLFGPIPIPPEAIDGVFTDTQIYFCIDYAGDRLTDESLWQRLTDAEQKALQSFLQSLGQFHFESFRRFPTFGACSPAQIDTDWCNDLAQALGLCAGAVRRMLSRAVGVIPTARAEAFLLHDIWGHNWQLMLTPFESDYDLLADCDDPLRAGETAYTPDGPLTCGELFTVEGDRVNLNEAQARLFFQGETRQRLGLLFTHLIGELVADVAEFKFVWEHPQNADELMSSSLFKNQPTKLDLGLADVNFLFTRVLKPLLELTLSVNQETRLEQDLLEQWRSHPQALPTLELRMSLKQAIARLYTLFFEEYGRFYLPTLDGDVGLFAQIVSNLLYLQNVVNQLYVQQPQLDVDGVPFQDLLMVFISSFCSSDSYAEFWDVDDAIAHYFLPCCYHLKDISDRLD